MSQTVELLKQRATELISFQRLTTSQIDAVNDVAWELHQADIKLTVQLSTKALQSAAQIDYSRGSAFALRGLGWGQLCADQYVKAAQTLEQSRAMFAALPSPEESGLASARNHLGSSHRYLGDFDQALENQLAALTSYEKNGETTRVASIYNNLGGIHSMFGDYALALDFLYQGIESSTPGFQAWIHCTLGDTLWRVGEPDQAVESLQRAISLFKEYQNRRNECVASINLGAAYHSVQKHQEALDYYQGGLEIARDVSNLDTQTEAYIYLGEAQAELDHYQTALTYLSKALELSKIIGSRYNESQALLQLGSVYHQFGDTRQGIETLESALDLSNRLGCKEIRFKANLALSKIYDGDGKPAAALAHYQAFHEGREEVFGSIASRQIERLLSRNDLRQTRHRMQQLRHQAAPKQSAPSHSALSPHNLRQVVEFIDNNLEENIKITELSQMISLNYAHFIRTFKHSTGKTPHQFLIEKRIERAKLLLKTTTSPLVEVALQCGFSSQSHLTTQFRLLTGTSPRQFRHFD